MFKRNLKEPIEKRLGKGKAIIIIGARQVGKTTLTKELIKPYDRNSVLILNGDTLEAQRLSKQDFPTLMERFGKYDCVLIDEAHKINRIGDIAKSIIDEFGKDMQLIMTGSSTVNLIDKTSEPLTGRKRVFELYPISLDEYLGPRDDLDEEEFEMLLRYGMYPEVLNGEDELDKQDAIMELAESTLYRDILDVTGARASGDLVALLRYLAQNSAVRVNINDASKTLHIDRRHIEKYIDLLIKSFIIFPIFPITKGGNTRTVRKAYKIYFWDVGVRNALLGDFSPTHERPDAEQLWQNFVICLLYTSPSPRDGLLSRMPSSA